jgi:signal transduction histidine kinase
MSEHLRFAPDVLVRLGEELNPSPEQGILELVRNAYDADAGTCTVELSNVSTRGGQLTIDDNGTGMTREQLRDAWLVLGRSTKDRLTRTPRYERLQVGSKGLGRLAALRMGPTATIRTRPESSPGTEHVLGFDWKHFAEADTVDLVDLDIVDVKTDAPPGTTIKVDDLSRRFTTGDVTRIARALVLLSSPFESGGSFRARLEAPEFVVLEELVRRGYWDQAAYTLRSGIGADGHAWAEMIDHEQQDRVVRATHTDLRSVDEAPAYSAPEAAFELAVFRLSGPGGTRGRTKGPSLAAIKEWLRIVGGVHLYHRGLRVYPYGDPGHDWLDMNLRRVSTPEERPSTNNSVGRVSVLDEQATLRQKTDRTGFIETPEFEDLRLFAQDVLDWAGRLRLAEAEARRRAERRRVTATLESAQTQMARAIAASPPESRKSLERADRAVRRATSEEVESMASDLELYRTLATIGTTTAVMAHEAFNPPNTIIKTAQSVRRRARKLLGADYEAKLAEPVDLIESSARRIQTLIEMPRRLLDRGKRRRGTQRINDVIRESLDQLKPLADDHRVTLETDLDGSEPRYIGTVAAVESIVTNLVINAISALDGKSGAERRVRVQTVAEDATVRIDVADNGPGIRNIGLDEIWLPGQGRSNRGVGLGLTIVRDITDDLGGRATAQARGELGGAQFAIEIPLKEAGR